MSCIVSAMGMVPTCMRILWFMVRLHSNLLLLCTRSAEFFLSHMQFANLHCVLVVMIMCSVYERAHICVCVCVCVHFRGQIYLCSMCYTCIVYAYYDILVSPYDEAKVYFFRRFFVQS